MQDQTNRARSPRATAPTIEDIERRAAQVLSEERQVLSTLVHCLRELAIACPVESRLPLTLAEGAQTLEVFTNNPRHTHADLALSSALDGIRRSVALDMPREGES
jgi:hypothetical protein